MRSLLARPLADLLLLVPDQELLGVGRRAMARSAAAGTVTRLRQGVYVETAVWNALTHEDQHLLRMLAFDRVSPGTPFSHWSAAAAHDLPVLRSAAAEVDITVGAHRGRGLVGVRAHLLVLPDEDVVQVGGIRVTSLARTAVDIAASASFMGGVVVVDAVLRALGRDGRELLAEAAARAVPRRGHRRIEAVLAFADGRSESTGESASRVSMHAMRLPVPELQHEFWDEDGLAARVDFWFPKHRVAGEMDGKKKYTDPRLNGGDAAQAVYVEKVREDRVRVQHVSFARWGWPEAIDGPRLARRLGAVGVLPL